MNASKTIETNPRITARGLRACLGLLALALSCTTGAELHVNQHVRITVLSTNLAELYGTGEWGWAALVEADGRCVLFDTGNHPETVLDNVGELDLDLSCVTDVVLSHHHADHTGGLLTLYRAVVSQHPDAFARVHVASGFFLSRPREEGREGNTMIAIRDELEASGVEFRVYAGPTEIMPGIWVTGPIERVHPEKNYAEHLRVVTESGVVPDYIPESQGLAVNTRDGFVVVLGCGHAGIINTLSYVRTAIAPLPIDGVMGGFHLFAAADETLDWVGREIGKIGAKNVMGAHCTGIEPLYRIRRTAGLSRQTAVIGSVGAVFESGRGFTPGRLAR